MDRRAWDGPPAQGIPAMADRRPTGLRRRAPLAFAAAATAVALLLSAAPDPHASAAASLGERRTPDFSVFFADDEDEIVPVTEADDGGLMAGETPEDAKGASDGLGVSKVIAAILPSNLPIYKARGDLSPPWGPPGAADGSGPGPSAAVPSMEGLGDRYLTLINASNPLPDGYVPDSLVRAADALTNKVPMLSAAIMGDSVALSHLDALLAEAAKDGMRLALSSGYRSYGTQSVLYRNKVNEYISTYGEKAARERAASVVAAPGTSEHQSGLAFDMNAAADLWAGLHQNFAKTKEGRWLEANAWRFGFVVRYAADKRDVTGIIWEPWHIRFVGLEHAAAMREGGLCLEEYVLPR